MKNIILLLLMLTSMVGEAQSEVSATYEKHVWLNCTTIFNDTCTDRDVVNVPTTVLFLDSTIHFVTDSATFVHKIINIDEHNEEYIIFDTDSAWIYVMYSEDILYMVDKFEDYFTVKLFN